MDDLDAVVVPTFYVVVVASSVAADAPPCPTLSADQALSDLLPGLQYQNWK